MLGAINQSVDLRSFSHYLSSCLAIAQEKLSRCGSLAEIATHEREINIYPRLDRLEGPHLIHLLNEDAPGPMRLAREAVVRGEVLLEHAAAGEGTRLRLGPKYFINIARDLSLERLTHLLSE